MAAATRLSGTSPPPSGDAVLPMLQLATASRDPSLLFDDATFASQGSGSYMNLSHSTALAATLADDEVRLDMGFRSLLLTWRRIIVALAATELLRAQGRAEPIPGLALRLLDMADARTLTFSEKTDLTVEVAFEQLYQMPINLAGLDLRGLRLTDAQTLQAAQCLAGGPHYQMTTLRLGDVSCDAAAALCAALHDVRSLTELRVIDGLPLVEAACLNGRLRSLSMRCPQLTELDLSWCHSLRQLGDDFFIGCDRLAAIQLPPTLTAVGDRAFERSGLRALDLGGCARLTRVGAAFLDKCRRLRTVALPASLARIGDDAMGQTALETIDLAHLSRLEALGDRFAVRCRRLSHVRLPVGLARIGGSALHGSGIAALDLSHNRGLRAVGPGFLGESAKLASVALPPSLATAGFSLLSQSSSLTRVDLSALTALTCLSANTLSDCRALTAVALPPSIERIGDSFLRHSGVTALDLGALRALTTIGHNFCRGCEQLAAVALPPGVAEIGDWAMAQTALTALDLRPLTGLRVVGCGLADRCPRVGAVLLPDGVEIAPASVC
jgi:hypothetical protein